MADASADLTLRIELEQARLLARQVPVLLFTGTLLPFLMALALVKEMSLAALAVWMTPLIGVALLRIYWLRQLRARPLDDALVLRFVRRMFVTALITGSTWGSLAIVLYTSSSLTSQLVLLVVITGMVAGAVNSLGAHLPVFLAFSLPMLVPHIVALSLVRQANLVLLGILTLAYLLSMLFVARNTNQAIRRAIRLRYENEVLAEERDGQRRLAEEASADKSRFLAAASHDLRQPLHALSLFFGSLEERNRQPDLAPLLDQIKHSLDSLHGLFSSLMDLSRLDAGAQRPVVRSFALGELMHQLEMEHFMAARARGLSLRVRAADAWVASDPVMLKRMLDNLLANAIRYTERGGVLLGCRSRGTMLSIEVWDTGSGIPASRLSDVFREFVQLGNPERNRERGLGLGLAIVRRLSLLLDHPVSVASRVGRGSRFAICVPKAQPTEALAGDGGAAVQALARQSAASILVIDDDARVREATRALLDDWGHAVRAACDERAAREHLDAGFAPDVLIVDYRLADGANGVQVAQRLIDGLAARPQVLIVSGDPLAQETLKFPAGGAVVLSKPVSAHALRVALSR